MEGELENYIYPTAGNPCVLRLVMKNGNPMCTLYMEHTFDTRFVQLAFADDVFKEQETLFRCDYMEPKDGGLPFLVILDIIKSDVRSYDDVKRGVRLEFVKMLITDKSYFDVDSVINEFRVRLPYLLDVKLVNEMVEFILPNFYGIVNGFAFVKDEYIDNSKAKDNQYIIRKTRLPEVYELYIDGVEPVSGNNIAYIPTMELSKKLKSFLGNKNSSKIQCTFNEERNKWIPVL